MEAHTVFRYETHLHTKPASRCARVTVREQLQYYKSLGYDGVFITNHFIDGNTDIANLPTYEAQIEAYFSDYEEGLEIGRELGISVFCGVEMSYGGTDFLIYGLDRAWYLAHPEIQQMKKSEELALLAECGALIVQAHPFREAHYIDHIRLFPRHVHGVEVINACRTEFENRMAELYAKEYDLIPFAGSDNHIGAQQTHLAGMCAPTPIVDEADFVARVKARQMEIFTLP